MVYGLGSAAEAQAVAAKYPVGTVLRANIAPREPFYVESAQLSIVEAKK
jgi:hypothetical protein